MKIVYFANHGNIGSDDTEGHIVHGLRKLGYEVIPILESEPHKVPQQGDLLLFHKGGPFIKKVLKSVKYKKCYWYFDKFWKDRPTWFNEITPLVDFGFVTDETFLKKNPNPKVRVLHQGIGDEDNSLGTPNPKYNAKVAFLGSGYSGRENFLNGLEKRFGKDFRQYNNVFNRDLYDLCASVPIIVAPQYPSDDYYWSSRIYMIMGSGGFIIHPYLKGLDEEYINGVHYVGYTSEEDMYEKIEFFLKNEKERKKIQMAGYKKTISDFTYTKRIEKLLNEIIIPR